MYRNPLSWNTTKLDGEKLVASVKVSLASNSLALQDTMNRVEIEAAVDRITRLVQQACDSSMPRRKLWNGRKQAYWWTNEIAELRRKALQLRRRAQRAQGRDEAIAKSAQHKAAKKELGMAIRASKAQCWRNMCNEVDSDPWGRGYKLATRKLGLLSTHAALDAETMANIVDALFPTHSLRAEGDIENEVGEIPTFAEEELAYAVTSLKNNKAPGPDGIPTEVLKVVAGRYPQLLLKLFNGCLTAGVFPSRWKMARLVLINKGKGGDPDSPSSYRPLCMLDTMGKLLEKLLKPRIEDAISAAGGLSPRQYGFRKGRSTINAIEEVINAVKRTESACHAARPLVLLATLDVRNAFNSARWEDMIGALQRSFAIPNYLLLMIRDYLRNRRLVYETSDGKKEKEITAGVAQGSILGPDLWNGMYDSLLRLEMPDEVFLVGYADDVAIVITSRNAVLAQYRLNQVMRRVNDWMDRHGLQLAISKTEIVMLTRRRISTIIPMKVGTEEVMSKGLTKYLGITLDNRLTYWEHIRRACDRASKVTVSLNRLMANIGGPRPSKRRLIMSTVQSILLYGAEIWAGAMEVKKYRTRMLSIQRHGALRVICAYRTVSEAAALVVAGVIPIDLLALERREIYRLSAEFGRKDSTVRARSITLAAWQDRWNSLNSGRWTARLIRDLGSWINRGHGELDFFTCQFFTGHGYFGAYLHKMGKLMSPQCRYCPEEYDDVFHTFFRCNKFIKERRRLTSALDGITPDTIVEAILRSDVEWRAFADYVGSVLQQKRSDGCLADP